VTWLAVLVADSTWYWMGRRYGNQSPAGRLPLALSPDRASRPPSRPHRWGLKSLAVPSSYRDSPWWRRHGGRHAGQVVQLPVVDLMAAVLWSSVGIALG